MAENEGWQKFDLNGDGCVDAQDALILVAAFGTSAGDPAFVEACDLDGDGLVNAVDWNEFRKGFLRHRGHGCD
jgi:hypothetical protein